MVSSRLKSLSISPLSLVPNHGIEHGNELTHTCSNSYLLVFSLSYKLLIQSFDNWVALGGAMGSHIYRVVRAQAAVS